MIYLNEVEALMYTVDGLKKAAGGAHALAHYQQNPNWLKIRDLLESLIEKCQVLATSKSMPRSDVLAELNQRQMNMPKDVNGN